jgi:DNA replication and repair protein RecF
MTLKVLSIEHLRKFVQHRSELHPRVNLIHGPNGSGKTTFLEAIYLLSCGRSFRTRETASLVTHGAPHFSLFAKTIDDQGIAIQKSLTSPTVMRLNNSPCLSASELARFLPSQVVYQDVFQIIDAGPAVRRSVLDWGLFHVKQHYYDLWRNYRRALKQRNALLRDKVPSHAYTPWNTVLSDLATEIDVLRQEYLQVLQTRFQLVLSSLSDIQCELRYFKGWDRKGENKSLASILADSLTVDQQYQYTRYGSHQAELLFTTGDWKVKHYLSRGQQKMVLFALKVAQAQLLSRSCVFLLDDLFAELDAFHADKLLGCIAETPGQFFLTAYDDALISKGFSSEMYNAIPLLI